MAKKVKQPEKLQNQSGYAAAVTRRPAPAANGLYFMQPRPAPPRAVNVPLRRRLEISIDPDTQAQVIHAIKITHLG